MSDAVKVAGLCCCALICTVSLLVGEVEFAISSGGLISLILGLPIVAKGIQKLSK